MFEPRVACGSQGERSSGRAGKDNAVTPKIALGRPMLCGLRMEEDSLLNSVYINCKPCERTKAL